MTISEESAGRPTAERIRVPKAAELIASRIRRDIVVGIRGDNDPLPTEAQLAEHFGVSRPTMREAYRILESEGLISLRRGAHRGGRVHAPNGDAAARYAGLVLQYRGAPLADLHEARAALEVPCVGLAAGRRTEYDLANLKALVDAARSAGSIEVLDLHHQFHLAVIEIAQNRVCSLLTSMIDGILEDAEANVAEARAVVSVKASERAQEAHERLLKLLRSRDSRKAEKLWQDHLDERPGTCAANAGR